VSCGPAWPPDFELINTMRGASGSSGARNSFVFTRYGAGILQAICGFMGYCRRAWPAWGGAVKNGLPSPWESVQQACKLKASPVWQRQLMSLSWLCLMAGPDRQYAPNLGRDRMK